MIRSHTLKVPNTAISLPLDKQQALNNPFFINDFLLKNNQKSQFFKLHLMRLKSETIDLLFVLCEN